MKIIIVINILLLSGLISFTNCKKSAGKKAIKGGIDHLAANFNPGATEDEGSCI